MVLRRSPRFSWALLLQIGCVVFVLAVVVLNYRFAEHGNMSIKTDSLHSFLRPGHHPDSRSLALTLRNVTLREQFRGEVQQLYGSKDVHRLWTLSAVYNPELVATMSNDTFCLTHRSERSCLYKHAFLAEDMLVPFMSNSDMTVTEERPSCAVVGKSGILLGSRYGSFIDRHDVILRPNTPPVVGYEVDVGSRTTAVTINTPILLRCRDETDSNSSVCQKYFSAIKANHVIMRMSCGPCDTEPLEIAARLLKKNRQPASQPKYHIENFSWSSAFREYEKRNSAESIVLSSGSELIFHALMHCSRVSIFGFYPHPTLPNGTAVPLYYYPNESWEMAQSLGAKSFSKLPEFHKFDAQHEQMLSWNASGLLDMYI